MAITRQRRHKPFFVYAQSIVPFLIILLIIAILKPQRLAHREQHIRTNCKCKLHNLFACKQLSHRCQRFLRRLRL